MTPVLITLIATLAGGLVGAFFGFLHGDAVGYVAGRREGIEHAQRFLRQEAERVVVRIRQEVMR